MHSMEFLCNTTFIQHIFNCCHEQDIFCTMCLYNIRECHTWRYYRYLRCILCTLCCCNSHRCNGYRCYRQMRCICVNAAKMLLSTIYTVLLWQLNMLWQTALQAFTSELVFQAMLPNSILYNILLSVHNHHHLGYLHFCDILHMIPYDHI